MHDSRTGVVKPGFSNKSGTKSGTHRHTHKQQQLDHWLSIFIRQSHSMFVQLLCSKYVLYARVNF